MLARQITCQRYLCLPLLHGRIMFNVEHEQHGKKSSPGRKYFAKSISLTTVFQANSSMVGFSPMVLNNSGIKKKSTLLNALMWKTGIKIEAKKEKKVKLPEFKNFKSRDLLLFWKRQEWAQNMSHHEVFLGLSLNTGDQCTGRMGCHFGSL